MKKQNKIQQTKSKTMTLAKKADRHDLYQRSVQNVVSEIDMIDKTFKSLTGRKAFTLREDFCGTANTSCEWIRRRVKNTAFGVDLDQEVLNWGNLQNVSCLPTTLEKRIKLINEDVLKA